MFIANRGTPAFRFCLSNSTLTQVLSIRYSFLSFVTHHCKPYNTESGIFFLANESYTRYNAGIRRCGGIGRRPGLKIPCPQGRAGSTPATGTTSEQSPLCSDAFFTPAEQKSVIRPLPCSSFPNRTRCAGLRFGFCFLQSPCLCCGILLFHGGANPSG